MAGDRLSRRDVLGGLMSAAAVGAAVRGTALASPAADDIRRSAGVLRLGSNENATGLGPAARYVRPIRARQHDVERGEIPAPPSVAILELMAHHHDLGAGLYRVA